MNSLQRIEESIKLFPRKFKVRFALRCCENISVPSTTDITEVVGAVKLWLEGKVSSKQVRSIADELYSRHISLGGPTMTYAVSCFYYLAYAASASEATSDANNVDYYVSTAVWYAAAHDRVFVQHGVLSPITSTQDNMPQYEADLKEMIQGLTKLEQVFYTTSTQEELCTTKTLK